MTTDNDFVAEKLGLGGSKCNLTLHEGRTADYYCTVHETYLVSDARTGHCDKYQAAPDLLANPWLLVEALWKRGVQILFDPDEPKCVVVNDEHHEGIEPIIDGNLPAALLQAAADMLRKESQP